MYKIFLTFICTTFFTLNLYSSSLKIIGLERLSINDIQSLTSIDLNQKDFNENDINILVKELYNSEQIYEITLDEKVNSYDLKISESPLIENIFINGNIYIKDEILLEILNSKKNSFLNKFQISKDINLISNLYSSRGFDSIKVNVTTEKFSTSKVNLIFNINEGNKTKLSSIEFEGNRYLSDDYLQSVIKSNFNRFYNIFSQPAVVEKSLIENDVKLLLDEYKKNGFNSIKISYSIDKNFLNSYSLVFFIEENERSIITNIDYNFSEDLKSLKNIKNIRDQFEKNLSSNNNYYDYYLIDNFVSSLNNQINKNNLNQELFYEIIFDNSNVTLNFYNKTLEPIIINKIDIYGNTITKTDVITSKLSFNPGDYYSKNKISKSKDKLQSYRYINSVNESINFLDDKADIIFDINENKKTGNLLLGGSFSGDLGLGLIFSIKDYNAFGTGNELVSDLSLNSEVVKFDILFKQYPFTNSSISNTYSVKNTETDFSSSYGYKLDQRGFGYSLDFEYLKDVYSSIGLEFLSSKGHSGVNQSDLSISDNIGSFDDVILKFSISQNKTNNTLYPNEGYYNSLTVKLSPDVISDNGYIMTNYKGDIYHSFNKSSDYIFLSNSLGMVESTSGRNKTINSFSLGGMNFKGFDYRGIGLKTSNNRYLGGNKYFTSTFGYGSNFLFDEKDKIYIRLFYTVGSLWDSDYISDNFKMRSSVGSSFDVLTPIGPITFSYAIPIQKESSDVTRNFNFSIGTAF